MTELKSIPDYTLFGETEPFPDVVHCEYFSARARAHGWRIAAHRHAYVVQIFLVRSGEVRALIDDQPHLLKAGHFLYIPAGKVHRFTFEPETEGCVVSIPLAVLNTIGPSNPDILAALSTTVAGSQGEELESLATMLSQTTSKTSPFRAQRAVGLAHSMLGWIAEHAMEVNDVGQDHVTGRLAELDHLIMRHMTDGWGTSDYACALSVSPGHLSRLCRNANGKGAASYIERRILEEACRLLAFTQLPVAEIGYRLGFSDPSYFSKRFRKSRSISPSDYRARFLA